MSVDPNDEYDWVVELTHQVWKTTRYVKDASDCMSRYRQKHDHALLLTVPDQRDASLWSREEAEEIALLAGRIRCRARILMISR